MQVPARHDWLAAHLWLQLPQLFVSVFSLAQVVPHIVWPVAH